MMPQHPPKFKEVPKYWWDFNPLIKGQIEVFSNHYEGPIAVYFYLDKADDAILNAKKHISDLSSGRISAPTKR